jgi:hypothetical protein
VTGNAFLCSTGLSPSGICFAACEVCQPRRCLGKSATDVPSRMPGTSLPLSASFTAKLSSAILARLPFFLLTVPHCDVAAATSTRLSLASHRRPPPSSRISLQGPSCPPPDYTPSSPPNLHPAQPDHKNSVLHPRVAVLLGVERHWHFPLLFCRALSTAPAAWWGLRCTLTFMGELLLDESKEEIGAPWSVERRFRVTEVFLAVLWVCISMDNLNWPP